jgi:signal peptidase II
MASGASRRLFWTVAGTVVVLDFFTKLVASANLSRVPRSIVGEWVTFQLVHNCGAAFGINVGSCTASRWVFLVLAIVALMVLGSMVRHTDPADRLRLTALAMVCGGAVGNVIDRIRSARGVVDFIDVGIGTYRWPTFNVADIAVTCGAIALAVVLWQEGRHADRLSSASDAAKASS